MNIIRVKLPSGTVRFKPFTVEEYRNLLLIRNEMKSTPQEKQEILDGLLEELYPEYSVFEREYIFLNVFLGSIGKTAINTQFTCPCCENKTRMVLRLAQPPLRNPELQVNNITFKFKLPERPDEPDVLFNKTIDRIYDGENEYPWSDLADYHEQLVDMISFDDFAKLSSQFCSVYVNQTVTCCKKHVIKFTRLLDLFEILLNPDEIFNFYRINRALVRNEYSLTDIMQMLPIERSIALTLVEKEIKDKNAGKK